MKKYLEPSMNIKELSFEDVVTTSGIDTLVLGEGVGSVSGGDGYILDPNALYFE